MKQEMSCVRFLSFSGARMRMKSRPNWKYSRKTAVTSRISRYICITLKIDFQFYLFRFIWHADMLNFSRSIQFPLLKRWDFSTWFQWCTYAREAYIYIYWWRRSTVSMPMPTNWIYSHKCRGYSICYTLWNEKTWFQLDETVNCWSWKDECE